jgi:hypothetical protein
MQIFANPAVKNYDPTAVTETALLFLTGKPGRELLRTNIVFLIIRKGKTPENDKTGFSYSRHSYPDRISLFSVAFGPWYGIL